MIVERTIFYAVNIAVKLGARLPYTITLSLELQENMIGAVNNYNLRNVNDSFFLSVYPWRLALRSLARFFIFRLTRDLILTSC